VARTAKIGIIQEKCPLKKAPEIKKIARTGEKLKSSG
tara:strand:+ start:222 stop:332 length:111 start_codon:yes stop_codon:yes gene_type:complete